MYCPACFNRDFTVTEMTPNGGKWFCRDGHEEAAYYSVEFDGSYQSPRSQIFNYLGEKDKGSKERRKFLLEQLGVTLK